MRYSFWLSSLLIGCMLSWAAHAQEEEGEKKEYKFAPKPGIWKIKTQHKGIYFGERLTQFGPRAGYTGARQGFFGNNGTFFGGAERTEDRCFRAIALPNTFVTAGQVGVKTPGMLPMLGIHGLHTSTFHTFPINPAKEKEDEGVSYHNDLRNFYNEKGPCFAGGKWLRFGEGAGEYQLHSGCYKLSSFTSRAPVNFDPEIHPVTWHVTRFLAKPTHFEYETESVDAYMAMEAEFVKECNQPPHHFCECIEEEDEK